MNDFQRFYNALLEHEFIDGKPCAVLYCEGYTIRERLGARLGTDADDPDIIALVEACERIQRQLCLLVYAQFHTI